MFGGATEQIGNFKDWLTEQNKEADSQLAAAAIGTAQFVASLGEGITRPLDIAANLAQTAVGVDDQQVRDELAGTKQFITGAADFVVNGDYAQAAKNVHQAAVNETVKAMEGDVTATANVTQVVLAAATLKSATKGKPKLTRENPSGPSALVQAETHSLQKIQSNVAKRQSLNERINKRGAVEVDPSMVRMSQSNVRSTLPDIVSSMKKKGFSGKPIDVVKMPDGGLTSIDNTRVMAGGLTNTKLKVRVREFDDPFPKSRKPEYFKHKKTKKEPETYGEAILNRISRQDPKWKKQNPQGGEISGVHKNTEPFDL